MTDVNDWIEKEVSKRFPDDASVNIPLGQLRVRIAKLCFDLADEIKHPQRTYGDMLAEAREPSKETYLGEDFLEYEEDDLEYDWHTDSYYHPDDKP